MVVYRGLALQLRLPWRLMTADAFARAKRPSRPKLLRTAHAKRQLRMDQGAGACTHEGSATVMLEGDPKKSGAPGCRVSLKLLRGLRRAARGHTPSCSRTGHARRCAPWPREVVADPLVLGAHGAGRCCLLLLRQRHHPLLRRG